MSSRVKPWSRFSIRLRALGVHDAVEAEVEGGLVELEELAQEGYRLVESSAHAVFSQRARIGTA